MKNGCADAQTVSSSFRRALFYDEPGLIKTSAEVGTVRPLDWSVASLDPNPVGSSQGGWMGWVRGVNHLPCFDFGDLSVTFVIYLKAASWL